MASGGETAVFTAFTTAAMTIIFLMFTLIILIGTAQNRFIQTLKMNTHSIKRWSGVILVPIGLWLLASSILVDFFYQLLFT